MVVFERLGQEDSEFKASLSLRDSVSEIENRGQRNFSDGEDTCHGTRQPESDLQDLQTGR